MNPTNFAKHLTDFLTTWLSEKKMQVKTRYMLIEIRLNCC